MTAEEYKKHHVALDERLIGYSATFEETRIWVAFESAVLVKESEAAFQQWLKANGIAKPVVLNPVRYGSLMENLHINGVEQLMDKTSLGRFREAMAADLRFLGAFELWESELGVLVEPVYNPYRDSISLFKPQIDAAVVGYYYPSKAADCAQLYGRVGDCYREDVRDQDVIAAFSWRSYQNMRLEGVKFLTDEIVQQRIEELVGLDRFCAETRCWEAR